jgi:hypothetical protein
VKGHVDGWRMRRTQVGKTPKNLGWFSFSSPPLNVTLGRGVAPIPSMNDLEQSNTGRNDEASGRVRGCGLVLMGTN